jgi:N-methylhydantoinase B
MTPDQKTVPIRDLNDAAFRERYGADRFTSTVIANRFRYIVEHLCTNLLTNAFSPILRDWYDFATTICGPPEEGYPTPAVSNSLIVFIGTMTDSVANAVREYGPERLKDGDVLITNDPYRTGTHVNDLLFIRPVFVEGRLLGFVNIKAHQLDMGGVVPGGFSGTKRNVYENGLVLSPRLLYSEHEPVRETWSLIFDNIRFVELVSPDMQTIARGLDLGDRLLRETVERYGVDEVLGAMRYATDASAERMTEAIAALDDGEWEGEDVVDCDGVDDEESYRVHVKIRKRGERVEVDLSGTSRQARTSINGTALDTKSAVAVAFKYLFDPIGTFTSGSIRPIDIVLPEQTLVSALPPDGPVFLFWEATNPVVAAIFRAFADVLGADAVAGDVQCVNLHNAHGTHPDGTPWVSAAQCGGEHGPWGGTSAGDADSYTFHIQANNIDPSLESIEADVPVVITRREYVADTAGAGENRGGAAVLKDSFWLSPAAHSSMPLRFKVPTGFGVNGGGEGKTGGVWLWQPNDGEEIATHLTALEETVYGEATPVAGFLDPATNAPSRENGEYVFFARVPVWEAPKGSTFRYLTNAGGGWGDPFARSPERVKRDVRDGYVTIGGAARDYGVVVLGDPDEFPEELKVDERATAELRSRRRSASTPPQ